MPPKRDRSLRPGQVTGRGKRKNDQSDIDSESQGIVGTFETLRDEGEHFVHVGQTVKAIESFTKALEMKNDDKNCLVARSRCWLQIGNATSALSDADEALNQEKDFIPALYRKAEALYQLGDFETALVYFHRGNKLRPEQADFQLGISKAQEAINNSIGNPATIKLEAKGDLSFFFKQQDELKKKKKQKQGYSKPVQKRGETKQRQRPTNTGESKTIKKLLEELYGDKQYLESLLKDESLTGKNTETSNSIWNLVMEELDYIDSRVEFWRQQKPLYARKKEKEIREKASIWRQKDLSKIIMKSLEEIDQAIFQGRNKEALEKGKKTLKTAESCSITQVPEKYNFVANLHSCLGCSYLELGQYETALFHFEQDMDASIMNDLEEGKSRSLDNLGRVYARMGKYEKAIEIWGEKLPKEGSPLEKAWLNHEIGRCHLELGDNKKAHEFGKKSLIAAEEGDNDSWKLNSSILCAHALGRDCQYKAAIDEYNIALQFAQIQEKKEAERAILTSINDIQTLADAEKKNQDEGNKNKDSDVEKTSEEELDLGKKEKSPEVTQKNGNDDDEDFIVTKEGETGLVVIRIKRFKKE